MLPVKVIWDYTYYWGVLAQFFFQGRIADLRAFSDLSAELAHCQRLNVEVQKLLRDWSAARPAALRKNPATMLDQASLPWFAELNRSLNDRLEDAPFRERIRQSTRQMRTLAAEIADRADGADTASLRHLLDERRASFDADDKTPSRSPEPLLFAAAT